MRYEAVYEELRRLAQRRLEQGLGGASLQATGLVHEVWLKLSSEEGATERHSSHFFATAAQAMRWILVDRARRRLGARRSTVEADDRLPAQEDPSDEDRALELLSLDEALRKLERSHPRKASVVAHRHFAGLSVEETATALGLSTATVKREWRFARAWLARELGGRESATEDSGES